VSKKGTVIVFDPGYSAVRRPVSDLKPDVIFLSHTNDHAWKSLKR
jgi:hypothetical protein